MSKVQGAAVNLLALLLMLTGCDSSVGGPAEGHDLESPAFSHGPAYAQTTGVNWHAQQQLTAFGGNGKSGAVGGAQARLLRNKDGISYQIQTKELNPGNAYSLWLVVINNPGACASTPCTARDILVNPNTDSQVRSGGTGRVAGGSGEGTMAGRAQAGPLSGWLEGRSLHNIDGAEVHLVINDHGPALPEFMPEMITTYRAGCSDSSPFPAVFPPTALADGAPGPNTCLLYQAAVFLAP